MKVGLKGRKRKAGERLGKEGYWKALGCEWETMLGSDYSRSLHPQPPSKNAFASILFSLPSFSH